MIKRRAALVATLLALGLLWFRLIDHLRIEWTLNPQYGYGWAVPALCGWMMWRRARKANPKSEIRDPNTCGGRSVRIPKSERSGGPDPELNHQGTRIDANRGWWGWALVLVAFCYLPTRLIAEANPEWRLVSWALTLEVIGLTVLLIKSTVHGPQSAVDGESKAQSPKSKVEGPQSTVAECDQSSPSLEHSITPALRHSDSPPIHESIYPPICPHLLWPLAFLLVAVPWPSFIEQPVIGALTRACTAITVEVVNALGVPALQHGNLIEVANGIVGIDEACSGIRSAQVALMLSLLFGEVYWLGLARRVWLCVGGLGLAFMFNVGRTTLLTCVADAKGVIAMGRWHDPAGAAILVGCFGSIWLLARWAARRQRSAPVPGHGNARSREGSGIFHDLPPLQLAAPGDGHTPALVSAVLLAWLIFCEVGTDAWYRAHELALPPPVTWTARLPQENPSFQRSELSQKAERLLRYDEGFKGAWEEGGLYFQAIYLRWDPGRTATYLAHAHTPQACVAAAGRRMISKSDVGFCVGGLRLPFHWYVFDEPDDPHGRLHVFYCLWEDRVGEQGFDGASLDHTSRLQAVLAGRRQLGQRSLELAIWGCQDGEEAQRVAEKILKSAVHADSPS